MLRISAPYHHHLARVSIALPHSLHPPPPPPPFARLEALASLAPPSFHLPRPLVNCQDYLLKEFLDVKWQGYIVSLAPIAIAVGVSHQLCVGLEEEIQVAVLRSFAQLLVLGWALKFILTGEYVLWSILGVFVMVLLAGKTAGDQAKQLCMSQVIATTSLAIGTLGSVGLLVFLGVFPTELSYLIPVTGHILGNAMIMVGRTLTTLHYEISQHTGQIEAALALGAAPYAAVERHIQRAFTIGMTPMVDAIKVMGLVSLPGNMTGLLMGGAVPVEAVKTQIKVSNAVLGASAISCLISALLGWHMLFTSKGQLQEK